MSRCFPYPPPGYFPRRTVDEALLESTKLQREKKAKEDRHQKDRKERKREKKEKKEKKREKKEKEKGKDIASDIGDGKLNDKKGQSQRIRKDEAEQLEKSDLTEEYGQPIYSQNSCHSSDSTQNSRKRKRDTSLSSGSSNHGNIIRLRLPLPKPKEPEASLTKEQNCSERLPLPKDFGPEASLGKEQSSSMRLPLLKHKEPEASVSKEQSSSMRLPLLKRKEPEASVSKEQSSSMQLPLLKHKEPEASLNKEKSCSISKHKEPETLLRKEQNRSVWMPLTNLREPEASLRAESCSTSGRVDLPAQQKYEISGQSIEAPPIFSMRTSTVDQKLNPDQQLLCSTSKVPEIVVQNDANASKGSRSSKSKKQRAESRYKALVEDWVPPLLQAEQTDLDDQEWLFQKHGDRHESKRHETINYDLCYGSWPRAQYLPEADVYALPYTVPF
ncbi:DNA ligase 1 isoform X2 [Vitis riparia]|uniref:DNA ligase 1 isoform X2 n=1 Tax=Vitis riparia TaxID=96939 RepID=UPI00155AE380|nr:DNA ligase 1 isoform X2 [Vitis riparia]